MCIPTTEGFCRYPLCTEIAPGSRAIKLIESIGVKRTGYSPTKASERQMEVKYKRAPELNFETTSHAKVSKIEQNGAQQLNRFT